MTKQNLPNITNAACFIPMFIGSASFLSSALVITIISRSETKFSTAYHRLVSLMSFWDMVGSFGMALSTIPIPKDVIYDFGASPTLGNFRTCEAQGFLVLLGLGSGAFAVAGLSVYYACSIFFKMQEDSIKKHVEPYLYLCVTVMGFLIPSVTLWFQMLNPTPYDIICMIGTYPYTCVEDEDIECIRGGSAPPIVHKYALPMCAIFLVTIFGIIVISMILIIWTVLKNELEISKNRNRTGKDQTLQGRIRISELKKTRVIVLQASLYIVAFLLIYIFAVVAVMVGYHSQEGPILFTLHSVFYSSQGCFNAIIFISHKVYNLRKSNTHMSVLEALRTTVLSPNKVPEILVSSISVVEKHGRNERNIALRLANINNARVGEGEGIVDVRRMNDDNDDDNSSSGIISFGDDRDEVEPPVRCKDEIRSIVDDVDSAYDGLSFDTPSVHHAPVRLRHYTCLEESA